MTEVADRYGVSRQSVHAWLRRYRQEGNAGLQDRSHRVHDHPWRIPAEREEAVCGLRDVIFNQLIEEGEDRHGRGIPRGAA